MLVGSLDISAATARLPTADLSIQLVKPAIDAVKLDISAAIAHNHRLRAHRL